MIRLSRLVAAVVFLSFVSIAKAQVNAVEFGKNRVQYQKFVISGDVLFQGSVGRTDLPGGNFTILEESIKTKLYTLPEDVIVHPGHGESTTIGDEMKTNPFVKMI